MNRPTPKVVTYWDFHECIQYVQEENGLNDIARNDFQDWLLNDRCVSGDSFFTISEDMLDDAPTSNVYKSILLLLRNFGDDTDPKNREMYCYME